MSGDSDRSSTEEYRVPDDHFQEYLAHGEELRFSPDTVRSYDSHLTLYVQFLHDSGVVVLNAELEDVLAFIEHCVRRGNRESTVAMKLSTVKEAYRYVRLRMDAGDELSLDPVELEDIDLSRYQFPEPIEREALSQEEVRRLFDAFDSYRNRLIAIVGVETGLRNSDLRTLRLADVDLEDLKLHVSDPKNSRPYDVPISHELAFEVDLWLRHHRGGYASNVESEYLFPGMYSEKLSRNGSLNTIIKEAAEQAGIQEIIATSPIPPEQQERLNTNKEVIEWKRVTVHTLRHTFITLLNDADVPITYRQLVANHKDPNTTERYTHGMDEAFEKIRQRFDPPR